MIEEFGNKLNWRSALPLIIFLYGIFSLPVSAFFIYMAVQLSVGVHTVFSVFIAAFILYLPYHHIRNLMRYAPLEYDGKYFIITRPLLRRSLHEVSRIRYVRKFFKGLFFISDGLPMAIPIHNMKSEDIHRIKEIIEKTKNI